MTVLLPAGEAVLVLRGCCPGGRVSGGLVSGCCGPLPGRGLCVHTRVCTASVPVRVRSACKHQPLLKLQEGLGVMVVLLLQPAYTSRNFCCENSGGRFTPVFQTLCRGPYFLALESLRFSVRSPGPRQVEDGERHPGRSESPFHCEASLR